MVWGCSQMTSAFFGVSDTPWCLCQPIISFWPAPWCFKLMTSFVNSPEPVVGARVCTQMTIIENSQSTIHLLQKGTSWTYWDPLRPSLDGFHRIVVFFVIHQLFLWPLIPLVSFCQLFNPLETNFSLTFSKKSEYIFLSYVSIEELFRK